MKDDHNLDMWTYWCEKYERATVLEDFYPNLLMRDAFLRGAITQIKTAEMAIDAYMQKLAYEAEDECKTSPSP
jgi:hypothetical protein